MNSAKYSQHSVPKIVNKHGGLSVPCWLLLSSLYFPLKKRALCFCEFSSYKRTLCACTAPAAAIRNTSNSEELVLRRILHLRVYPMFSVSDQLGRQWQRTEVEVWCIARYAETNMALYLILATERVPRPWGIIRKAAVWKYVWRGRGKEQSESSQRWDSLGEADISSSVPRSCCEHVDLLGSCKENTNCYLWTTTPGGWWPTWFWFACRVGYLAAIPLD